MYGISASGWIDSELFSEWFCRHFLRYAPNAKPLLLLLDGHSSHYNPSFIHCACENGVIVFCLPPHTTHIAQPLDATCFHSLKCHWDQACDDYMSSNPGKCVTIYQFSELFAKAWRQAMTPSNIVSGFRVTEEEDKKYQSRYEEGYDLDIDARYNLWLKLNHPSSKSPSLKLFTSSDDTSSRSSLPLSLSSTPQQAPLSPVEPCSQKEWKQNQSLQIFVHSCSSTEER